MGAAPGPSLNSSPVCQGVAVLLIIITVCKSICKSHTALGLLANANAAHAHLLEGQLYTFLLIPWGEWEECVREGLRAARGHRGLDHSDRPPPITWNKVGVLTNQHPVLDQPLPGLEVLFQAHPPFHRTLCFSLGLCLRHTPPRTQNWDRSSPAFGSPLPGRDPGLRAPGGRRGESWSRLSTVRRG